MFTIKKLPARSYEKFENVQMSISFEMNLDKLVIVRKCYGFLDLLSDLGGMIGILMSSFAIAVKIINYNNFDNYMTSRLFKVAKAEAKTTKYKNYFEISNFIDYTKYHNFLEYFISKLPCKKRYCCCR